MPDSAPGALFLYFCPPHKAATESLTKVFYEISAKMYQQANPEGGMDPNMGANEAQGEVVDDE